MDSYSDALKKLLQVALEYSVFLEKSSQKYPCNAALWHVLAEDLVSFEPFPHTAIPETEGCDVSKDQVILPKGTLLEFKHLPLLAALGISSVKVLPHVRIGVWSVGVPLHSGAHGNFSGVRNATQDCVVQYLRSLGFIVDNLGRHQGNSESAKAVLQEWLRMRPYDVLLCIGGVGLGNEDFVRDMLADLNSEMIIDEVNIRPAARTCVAKLGCESDFSPLFFGLPGKPLATLVALRFFVYPFLRALLGCGLENPSIAKVGNPAFKPSGVHTFLLGNMSKNDYATVYFPAEQESFRVLPLARASVWAMVPSQIQELHPGQSVEVFPLFPHIVY